MLEPISKYEDIIKERLRNDDWRDDILPSPHMIELGAIEKNSIIYLFYIGRTHDFMKVICCYLNYKDYKYNYYSREEVPYVLKMMDLNILDKLKLMELVKKYGKYR